MFRNSWGLAASRVVGACHHQVELLNSRALQVSGQTQRRRRQRERVADRRLLGPSSLSPDLKGSLDEAREARVAVARQSCAAELSDP